MAALKKSMWLQTFDCPACDHALAFMVRLVPSSRPAAIEVEVDYKPVQDHIGLHLAGAN